MPILHALSHFNKLIRLLMTETRAKTAAGQLFSIILKLLRYPWVQKVDEKSTELFDMQNVPCHTSFSNG